MESSSLKAQQPDKHRRGGMKDIPAGQVKFSDFITLSVSDKVMKDLGLFLKRGIASEKTGAKTNGDSQKFRQAFGELRSITLQAEMEEFSKLDLKKAEIDTKRKTPSPLIDVLGDDFQKIGRIPKKPKASEKTPVTTEYKEAAGSTEASLHKTSTQQSRAGLPNLSTPTSTKTTPIPSLLPSNAQTAKAATSYFDPFDTPTKTTKRTDPLRTPQSTPKTIPKQQPTTQQPFFSSFGELSQDLYGRRFTGISSIEDYVFLDKVLVCCSYARLEKAHSEKYIGRGIEPPEN